MQRRSGGARIDRGRGVPRFPAAAAARPGALRSQPAHQLQAGLMSLRPVPDPVPWRLPRGTARAVALLALLAVAPGAPRPASAALEIEVTSGVRDPVPIAIVPFAPSAPAEGAAPEQHFQLIVADADGANQHLVLESRFPLMSPAWSPDGQYLAYVSFETKHSGVYVQRVKSGERRQVSARAGVNGAPEWSPDGRKLALTLGGGGGNPDIYILDLTTQDLMRITDDPAIDTEPVWAPDGRSLYFTSDRAGSPQVYQINAQPGAHPKRITFGGTYNARPRVSPDGTQLAMVTLDNAAYRIAVQDLSSGAVRVLSHGRLDESPSFAPNGATLIYSERDGERGVLATVSIDGLTGLRLKAPQGEVREPAWGPFSP